VPPPSFALKDKGFETIMINCTPETVSPPTTHAAVYFQSVTFEYLMAVIETRASAGGDVSASSSSAARPASSAPWRLQDCGRSEILPARKSPDSIDLGRVSQAFLGPAREPEIHASRRSGSTATSPPRLSSGRVNRLLPGGGASRPTCSRPRDGNVLRRPTLSNRYMNQRPSDAARRGILLVDKFSEDAFEFDVERKIRRREPQPSVIGGIMESYR